jgi:threonyl-tRNA synthetase
MLLPIADRHTSHAEKIAGMLQDSGIRAEINSHSDTLQAKIREATLQKVPFMGIIGDKEVADDAISIRLLNGEDLGTLGSDQILQKVKETIDKKK